MLHETDTRMKSSWTISSGSSSKLRATTGAVGANILSDAHHPDSLESSNHPSVQQMRSVMAGLLTALRVAIDDDRNSPEERLRRASAILQGAGEQRRPARLCVRGGLAPWQARRVASYIDTNLGGCITLESLAGIARLSRAHFSRAFRATFGDRPIVYIIRRRIERAQEMMLSTNASLSQITHDCGFVDQAYLCKLFRRYVGESPGTWRRARFNGTGSDSSSCHSSPTFES